MHIQLSLFDLSDYQDEAAEIELFRQHLIKHAKFAANGKYTQSFLNAQNRADAEGRYADATSIVREFRVDYV